MAKVKISELTAKGSNLASTDLVPIAEDAGGGIYTTKSVNGTQIGGGGGLTVGTTAITSGTIGRVLFQGTGNVLQQDAAFFWDNTNKRLGIGATPSVELDVNGRFNFYQTNNGLGKLSLINNTGTGNFLTFNYTNPTYPNSTMFAAGVGFNLVGGNNYHGEITLSRTAPSTLITTRIGAANDSYLRESNLVLGATTAGARLDVRAQGTLSTDIAFRVRNSADTGNLFDVQGDGVANVRTRMNCGFSGMTSTGGALFVYAGNNNDYVSRFYNTTGNPILNIRTTGNGSQIELCNASGSVGLTLNGIYSNAITLADSRDIAFGTGGGTKIASATNQKFSFWNATPIEQPTTAVAAATVVHNAGGTAIKTDDTFDGYTLSQIVKALRNTGLLA